jgi:hypothetical protein
MAFCTRSDLEIAVGGAKYLLQLADRNKTGNPNDANVVSTINGWLDEGASRILQKASIKHEPEVLANLDAASLVQCRRWNKALAGRLAYRDGAAGLAMPEQLADGAREADEDLVQLAEGKIRLARVAGGKAAALGQPVGVVDYDPLAKGLSIAGLKLGFR